ncbi:hypothetical protein [Caldimonas caldifontis]|uniref:hypothetical protein n=1 Tax=Caldimonas caldifontis TaxID=1452508 RepID=UPI0011B09149|nr:hypothetical protein [Caldimonas caldifontis]
MRKTMWFGLAVLALVLAIVAAIVTSPPDGAHDAGGRPWMPWLLLVGFGAITLGSFHALSNRHIKAPAAASPSSAASVHAPTEEAPHPTASPAPLNILACAVATVAGRDTATVLQTLCDAPPLPSPDPELIDDRGLPRLSARCQDLELDGLASALSAVQPQSPLPRPSVQRALALQLIALEGLQDTLARKPAADGLDVLWMVPTHWSERERAQAQAWLAAALSGLQGASTPAPRIHLVGASEPATTLQRLLVHASTSRCNDVPTGFVLALACDSRVDAEAGVDASRGAPPLPPGEGAAALALRRSTEGAPSMMPTAERQCARVQIFTPTQPSGDAAAPTGSPSLRELVERALEGPEACKRVTWAVSDIGLTGPSARDVLDCLVERLPGLDLSQRLCRMGVACGDLGAATSLVALALASQAASQAPTMMLLSGLRPAVALLTPSGQTLDQG